LGYLYKKVSFLKASNYQKINIFQKYLFPKLAWRFTGVTNQIHLP